MSLQLQAPKTWSLDPGTSLGSLTTHRRNDIVWNAQWSCRCGLGDLGQMADIPGEPAESQLRAQVGRLERCKAPMMNAWWLSSREPSSCIRPGVCL